MATDSIPLVDALKSVSDMMQVLITINSALIGGTVAFQKDFFAQRARGTGFVTTAFILFGQSIAASVWCLMGITGCIANPPPDGIYHSSIRVPATLALVSFAFGIGAYVMAGISALHAPRPPDASAPVIDA